jgi:hypothetical protein
MKVKLEIQYNSANFAEPQQLTCVYSSIRYAALALGCSARHLSDQLKGRRSLTKTNLGTVIKIEAYHEHTETDSTASPVPEHPFEPQKDPEMGPVAPSGGWGRVKQAMEQIAAAGKRLVSKFYKPKHVE